MLIDFIPNVQEYSVEGNNTFYRHAAADTLLEVRDLDWIAWQDAEVYHASSISLSVEPSRSATLAAIDYTQRVGSIVSFDANPTYICFVLSAASKSV